MNKILRASAVPILLYLVGTALLLFRLGGHPPFPYNWETDMIWHMLEFWDNPSLRIFALTDGLITDSGKSPFVVLPIWGAFKLAGIGLTELRTPTALIVGAVIPLFWFTARRMTGSIVATLATILLMISPVFLLYGRTATNVGISLVPELLTFYALLTFIQKPREWHWLLLLQLLLLANTYAYAPMRLFWPISLILFAVEILFRSGSRRIFTLAFTITLVTLPLFLTLFYGGTNRSPIAMMARYYNARGEHVFSLKTQTDYSYYLRDQSKPMSPSTLFAQNAKDYGNKLIDKDTTPALLNYWTPTARLYPRILAPFLLIGLLYVLLKAKKEEYRMLLIVYGGLTVPMLLTSHADIPRLIFSLPPLFLFVAIGFMWTVRNLYCSLVKIGLLKYSSAVNHANLVIMSIILVIIVGMQTWKDYHIAPTIPADQTICSMLKNIPPTMPVADRSHHFGCE